MRHLCTAIWLFIGANMVLRWTYGAPFDAPTMLVATVGRLGTATLIWSQG